MNWLHQIRRPCFLLTLCFAALLAAGCATSGTGSNAARPGDGLREYQRLVLDLRQDVNVTRQTVEALIAATPQNSAVRYARFDNSLQRLEVDSIKARARVDAMEQRGEAYFEEWAEEISGTTDEAAHHAARERLAELHGHFEAILKDTGLVRQAFRPFLEATRRLRTVLGPGPRFEAIEQAKPACAQIVADGQRVSAATDQLLKTLKTAEKAMMSGSLPPVKPEGKS